MFEQLRPILVTVRPHRRGPHETFAVVLMAPESRAPTAIPGFNTVDAARAHAKRHWPNESHVTPAQLDAEVDVRQGTAQRARVRR